MERFRSVEFQRNFLFFLLIIGFVWNGAAPQSAKDAVGGLGSKLVQIKDENFPKIVQDAGGIAETVMSWNDEVNIKPPAGSVKADMTENKTATPTATSTPRATPTRTTESMGCFSINTSRLEITLQEFIKPNPSKELQIRGAYDQLLDDYEGNLPFKNLEMTKSTSNSNIITARSVFSCD